MCIRDSFIRLKINFPKDKNPSALPIFVKYLVKCILDPTLISHRATFEFSCLLEGKSKHYVCGILMYLFSYDERLSYQKDP